MQLRVTDKFFDLKAFETVEVVKEIEFTAADSVEAALARVGNDSNVLLGVINKGLQAQAKKDAKNDSTGWHTFDDEGEINGAFDGIPGDEKKVNSLRLTLAKTAGNFNKDMSKEQKRAAKESAEQMIKMMISTGVMKAESLAPSADSDTE